MADEAATQEKPKLVIPHGAQCMRKLRGGLKALVEEVTGMAAPLDEGPAKSELGGFVSGLSESIGGIEKAWAKFYKEHDIDASDDPAPEEMKADPAEENKPEATPEGEADGDAISDEDIDAALAALAALDDDAGEDSDANDGDPDENPTEKSDSALDDEDDEANMTPEEKRQIESRIKRLERLAAK